MRTIFTLLLLLVSSFLQAQNFNIAERYGLLNLTFNGVEVVNNNYYFCGYGQDSVNPLIAKLYILETNDKGEELFLNEYIDSTGTSTFSDPNGIKWYDDHFLISGSVQGTSDGNKLLLLKLDTNGYFSKVFQFTETYFQSLFNETFVKGKYGNIYVAGGAQKPNFDSDAYILKLDRNDSIVWKKLMELINKKRKFFQLQS